jgi:hypothetical protein
MHEEGISIWFFIGISLLVNGVLIAGAGAWEMIHPPANPVVLFHLHANFYWGLLLLVAGIFYCVKFRPHRGAQSQAAASR